MRLTLRDVSKSFRTRGGAVGAIDHINLDVADGEFVCIIGPSGCGKSTLLNLIAGMERPDDGEVLAGGEPVTEPLPTRVLLFQDAALFPWLNVEKNVEFGLRMNGVAPRERHDRSTELLRMVHLERFRHSWIHELSGGMKQRVALARALAVGPQVLLLDEPFGALDAITRDLLHIELQEVWRKTGATVVFVTHNVREAVVLADRVLVMSPRPGRFVAEHQIIIPRPRRIENADTAAMALHISKDLRVSREERE